MDEFIRMLISTPSEEIQPKLGLGRITNQKLKLQRLAWCYWIPMQYLTWIPLHGLIS